MEDFGEQSRGICASDARGPPANLPAFPAWPRAHERNGEFLRILPASIRNVGIDGSLLLCEEIVGTALEAI